MVWMGMVSFLVPAMVIWQCRMPLACMKGRKVSGNSLSTKVLVIGQNGARRVLKDHGIRETYMIVFNPNF